MTHRKIIIGITGMAGSGKDTVRAILEAEHAAHGMAFADPMRTMISALFVANGIDTRYMLDREFKEQPIPGIGVSYRQMAQTLGTQWGRDCLDADIWVRIAAAKVRDLDWQRSAPGAYVISDVRFDNEAEWIRAQGGVIWRVRREQARPVRTHASELYIENIKSFWTLENHGSFDELRDQVREAFIDTVLHTHATPIARKLVTITPRIAEQQEGGAA